MRVPDFFMIFPYDLRQGARAKPVYCHALDRLPPTCTLLHLLSPLHSPHPIRNSTSSLYTLERCLLAAAVPLSMSVASVMAHALAILPTNSNGTSNHPRTSFEHSDEYIPPRMQSLRARCCSRNLRSRLTKLRRLIARHGNDLKMD